MIFLIFFSFFFTFQPKTQEPWPSLTAHGMLLGPRSVPIGSQYFPPQSLRD
jgi:hypothetical protein